MNSLSVQQCTWIERSWCDANSRARSSGSSGSDELRSLIGAEEELEQVVVVGRGGGDLVVVDHTARAGRSRSQSKVQRRSGSRSSRTPPTDAKDAVGVVEERERIRGCSTTCDGDHEVLAG